MKKFGKLLCAILGVGFLVAGCATVSPLKNSETDILYNGNSAVMVSDHLYFGNSFAGDFSKDSDYKDGTKLAYLARVDLNNIDAKNADFSPKKVENVANEVTVQSQNKNFSFVLGDKIYYSTPNRQQFKDESGKASHYFNYTTLYRSSLDGNHKEKLYTTNGEVKNIEALKFGGKYYIVMLAGENLIKIEIGSKVSTSTIASKVQSVAIPKTYQKDKVGSSLDWNGQIFYTTAKTDEDNPDISGSYVNKVSIAGGDVKSYFVGQGQTLTFLNREKNVMFYSLNDTTTKLTEIYKFDSNNTDGQQLVFGKTEDRFFSETISDINLVASENGFEYGYTYLYSSKLNFTTRSGKEGNFVFKNGDDNIDTYKVLLVSGRTAYISTTTSIFKANLSSAFSSQGGEIVVECETVVSMTAIYDGNLYAFDGKYIYYYAKLETVDTDEDGDTSDEETDDTYYLYRARVGLTGNYQLLSSAKSDKRHTKG